MPVLAINPMRCRMWSLHSRLDEGLTEESCRSLIDSMAEHGQLVPALGRQLRDTRDYDIELIYGARRLYAARHLNQPLLVDVRPIEDRDGLIAMDVENRLRVDISPYERGRSYARWLEMGLFASQEEICAALQMSSSQVSRLLQLARLPAQIIEAFSHPSEIREVWGAELASRLAIPGAEQELLLAAKALSAVMPRPKAEEIYQQLCAAVEHVKPKAEPRVVTNDCGMELYRIKQHRDKVVFSVPMAWMSADTIEELESTLAAVMS